MQNFFQKVVAQGLQAKTIRILRLGDLLRLIPTILCGSTGSRFWPVSREQHLKPFIRLADGQSLLHKAFLRGAQLLGVAEVLTVTNRELFFKTEHEFRDLNTAGGQKHLSSLSPSGATRHLPLWQRLCMLLKLMAIMLVLAADHLISDQGAFQQPLQNATELAALGKLVTFGIQPEAPEIGYGYIEADGNTVLRFVEKPSLEKAQEYLASGQFLWNSGIFCFSAGSLLREMGKHHPQIIAVVRVCIEQFRASEGKGFVQVELDPGTFATVPEDSIDYAVMEKSDQVAVVPCNIGWSDIGSLLALADLDQADTRGNRVQGEVMLHATDNCTIRNSGQSNGRLIATVCVKNLIMIDTPDAVLVADESCAQDVKHIFAQLKLNRHDTHKLHRTAHRPWGTNTVLEEGVGFKIKRIEMNPSAKIILQMHHHRSEHWVVVSGVAKVINGENELIVNTNQSTYIPAGHKHRLENEGESNLVVIEVQSGAYLSEDEIERFEDSYVRC